jgi:hypothetical protein
MIAIIPNEAGRKYNLLILEITLLSFGAGVQLLCLVGGRYVVRGV